MVDAGTHPGQRDCIKESITKDYQERKIRIKMEEASGAERDQGIEAKQK